MHLQPQTRPARNTHCILCIQVKDDCNSHFPGENLIGVITRQASSCLPRDPGIALVFQTLETVDYLIFQVIAPQRQELVSLRPAVAQD